MDDYLSNEAQLRLGVFLGLLILMVCWEQLRPRRTRTALVERRWLSNLGLSLLNSTILQLAFPFLGAALALAVTSRGWGLLNLMDVPVWFGIAVSIIALDLLIYLQHRLFHGVPLLWRLHRMHHADPSFDTTTGVRFHPLEAVLSMCIKSAAIVILGVRPDAFLIFEILLNGTSLFNHGNVRIASGIDAWLRWLIVTPDMHRVHHSEHPREYNRNFGFNLPWWDRLLGTYKAQPDAGHVDMTIGTREFRDAREQRLGRLLTQPFRSADGQDSQPGPPRMDIV